MKDASIQVIKAVERHPNADALSICSVLGFRAITKLDQYKVGDVICYIAPDSVLPDKPWAEPYKRYAQKRVRSIRLRGVWSEGLIIPLSVLDEIKSKRLNCEANPCINDHHGHIQHTKHAESEAVHRSNDQEPPREAMVSSQDRTESQ